MGIWLCFKGPIVDPLTVLFSSWFYPSDTLTFAPFALLRSLPLFPISSLSASQPTLSFVDGTDLSFGVPTPPLGCAGVSFSSQCFRVVPPSDGPPPTPSSSRGSRGQDTASVPGAELPVLEEVRAGSRPLGSMLVSSGFTPILLP